MIKPIFFCLLLFVSCNRKDKLDWRIELTDRGDTYTLTNFLTTPDKDTILTFDLKAFSYSCLENNPTRSGTILIENKNGQFRRYSDCFFEENEIKDIPEDNCMFSWEKTFQLHVKMPSVFEIEIPYLSDLKVSSDDNKVRLYYFDSVFSKKDSIDWDSFYLTSNWIEIPEF